MFAGGSGYRNTCVDCDDGANNDVNFGGMYEFTPTKIYEVALSSNTFMDGANGRNAGGTIKISLRKHSNQTWEEKYSQSYPLAITRYYCNMSNAVDGEVYDAIKVEYVNARGWDVAIGGIHIYGREDV